MSKENRMGHHVANQDEMMRHAALQAAREAAQQQEFMAVNMIETARGIFMPLALDVCRGIVGAEEQRKIDASIEGIEYVPSKDIEIDLRLQLKLAKACANLFMRGPAGQPKPEGEQSAPAEEKKSPILTP